MRVLIFGDSHVGTLYRSYVVNVARSTRMNSWTLDFVAAAGPVAGLYDIRGSTLSLRPRPDRWQHAYVADETIDAWYKTTADRIRAISGSDQIAIDDYDCLVILGGHLMTNWHYVLIAASSGHFSSACVQQTCKDVLIGTLHARWLAAVTASQSPLPKVFSVAEPLRNAAAADLPEDCAGLHLRGVERIYTQAVHAMGAEFIAQPATLLSQDGNATHPDFRSANQVDFTHLNDNGAEILFRHVMERLATAEPHRAA